MTEAFGIDVGGTGGKAAIVDVDTGTLLTERVKVRTPEPIAPEKLAEEIAGLVRSLGWAGPVGMGFPAVIRSGVVSTANNIHPDWIGVSARELLQHHIGHEVFVLNDADGAGLAEMRLGLGKGEDGVVIVLTFGSGIGSGMFARGNLIPNVELGALDWGGEPAEAKASARARKEFGLTWEEWAGRVNWFLKQVERLLAPDLLLFSGGVSKHSAEFLHLLETSARLMPAYFLNNSGIVGAALAAHEGISV